MCEVPPRKVEGNWRERQGMKKAQAGRAGAGGSGEGSPRLPAHTHGALSHLSALRDSWEEHEAQHVPSRIDHVSHVGECCPGEWPGPTTNFIRVKK